MDRHRDLEGRRLLTSLFFLLFFFFFENEVRESRRTISVSRFRVGEEKNWFLKGEYKGAIWEWGSGSKRSAVDSFRPSLR